MPHPFDRYADVTDLASLKEWTGKPLRKSLRVNTLKCSVEEMLAWGKSKNWDLKPVPWCREGFFVDREDREEALGKDFMHILGNFYLQEAASMLPVTLLDPKPGERILDMSAAPGSKTTQIGAAMQGRGVLIANDVQEKRIWSLLTNLQRCGVTNACITRKVGQWFAGNLTEAFDRVLCDAPCTAQGTARKDSDALTYCSIDNIGKMARLQRELLESAIHACKVGGRIVYSTCTLTPEENEDVVLSLLQKYPNQLSIIDPAEILPCDMSGPVKHSHVIQEFLHSKNRYPMIRLWPQTLDTEGFFSVAIQKNAPTRDRTFKKDQEPHRWPLMPNARKKEVANRLEDWYGATFIRENEVLYEVKEQLFVLPDDFTHFFLPVAPYAGGLPFGKTTNHGLVRASHEIATLRGQEVLKQLLRVSEAEMRQLLRGANIPASPAGFDDGDALLCVESPAIGRDLVFGRGMLKNGIILNRLPRDIVRMFS
jgi:16S rRNA (cytosine1407-C5)-methyltransferase